MTRLHSAFTIIVSVALPLLFASCCPRNPAMNTAISAHGNTDWHIDTANEFLFGTDMAGNATAPNHCPDSWTRRHVHVGLTGTNHFYYDGSRGLPGDDTDAANGIDGAMLFFYAGHGSPTLWNTLGNNATQNRMKLGNCAGGRGTLRYYWQCSCEVFAHGPENCAGGMTYGCPGGFDGSADSAAMRNVYERWGPVLSPELRMACGASTLAYCHEAQADRIWDNYNNRGFDVADSFLDGLNVWGVVPLCITVGGPDVTATPLYDTAFTDRPNRSGTSHYHIQYLSGAAAAPRASETSTIVPRSLPVYKVAPQPLPGKMRGMKFETRDHERVSAETVGGREPLVRTDVRSGAVFIRGERRSGIKVPVLDESAYVERAMSFLREKELIEADAERPDSVKVMIDSVPVGGKPEAAKRTQKNVLVTLKRRIDVEGAPVRVLGDGGVMSVQMNNDGSVLNASKIWRRIAGVARTAAVKSYEDALREAEGKIGEPKAYKVDRWTWGYKELGGSADQSEMKIVFQFAFVPADRGTILTYPPRVVEVAGQAD